MDIITSKVATSADSDNVTSILEGCPADSAAAGRANVCESCPGRELCLSQGSLDPDQPAIDLRMNAIKHKILVVSGKGGVGKSSMAAALSNGLSTKGKKVGLLDLDICGPSQAQLMGVDGEAVMNTEWGWKPVVSPHTGVKVISVASLLASGEDSLAFRGPRKTALIKRFVKDVFWGRLDYLIIDTPPGTSDEHLTVVKILQNTKPDGAIIVTTPQSVALATVRKEIDFCSKMRVNIIGIVENMSAFACPCCGEVSEIFSSGGGERLAEEFGLAFLGRIPIDPSIAEHGEEGSNLVAASANTTGSQALLKTCDNVIRIIEG
ncbi:PREDICTED: cytosolic Fe-S cluster assembly factor NUBP2 homolog [Priapulus caudatus]|uniref:Cytosolic Fe-S cluster assembly factor NUBP2 homolog n=1 Tax=Priapulus caudatus TaxID=37621 RepID=A0ABM1E8D3_PRICU|nr:PREDICTED: cytosolic Fe-S cluster assembly factor NUBP2 homolog [Priapulus caudatus]